MIGSSYMSHMNKIADEARKLGMFRNVRSSKEEAIANERTVSTREINDDYNRRTKQGRNEPCNCGSGLKFKKCCGKVINKED